MHAQEQLTKIVSFSNETLGPGDNGIQAEAMNQSCRVHVMFMMVKGESEDLFVPSVWASEKAKEYWLGKANQDLWMHAQLMEGYCIGAINSEELEMDCFILLLNSY